MPTLIRPRRFALACGVLAVIALITKADDITPPPPGYTLVWSDDFKNDPDGLPDPSKWSFEEGFLRNHESQYYTKERLENARVETYGKADWLYGRIEVRAKLPAGKGVWPAIWMLGSDARQPGIGWPRCGEIDIMEFVGKQPNVIHGTMHYFTGKHASIGKQATLDHPEAGFHVYAADWTPDYIDISVDGQVYNHFAVAQADFQGQNPFHKPQYLLLNLALGGDWGGHIDDSIFPQRLVIDYVRVYQKAPAP
jgi:beta-glucanase (GH16 family)